MVASPRVHVPSLLVQFFRCRRPLCSRPPVFNSQLRPSRTCVACMASGSGLGCLGGPVRLTCVLTRTSDSFSKFYGGTHIFVKEVLDVQFSLADPSPAFQTGLGHLTVLQTALLGSTHCLKAIALDVLPRLFAYRLLWFQLQRSVIVKVHRIFTSDNVTADHLPSAAAPLPSFPRISGVVVPRRDFCGLQDAYGTPISFDVWAYPNHASCCGKSSQPTHRWPTTCSPSPFSALEDGGREVCCFQAPPRAITTRSAVRSMLQ